eukprot:961901-Rhodomonas_salina.1
MATSTKRERERAQRGGEADTDAWSKRKREGGSEGARVALEGCCTFSHSSIVSWLPMAQATMPPAEVPTMRSKREWRGAPHLASSAASILIDAIPFTPPPSTASTRTPRASAVGSRMAARSASLSPMIAITCPRTHPLTLTPPSSRTFGPDSDAAEAEKRRERGREGRTLRAA